MRTGKHGGESCNGDGRTVNTSNLAKRSSQFDNSLHSALWHAVLYCLCTALDDTVLSTPALQLRVRLPIPVLVLGGSENDTLLVLFQELRLGKQPEYVFLLAVLLLSDMSTVCHALFAGRLFCPGR